MQPIQLFDLASRQAEWLTIRQQVVAGNIANANTPKFHAKDVTPFDAVLDNSNINMARTNPAHLSGNDFSDSGDIDVKDAALDQEIGVQESGNTVGLAEELSKSGDIKRQYDLNTSLVSSFNRMMLMTVRK
ncbi:MULTISPECIES: flagellar basal body rod protein FlgB [Rhizobium]|jgi:flagellar basal-body rod protein FlgB|uniref:Flagellar basal body rod protein FlgB n=1 Tax=Rhizobium leguminosarum bv. trifolii (strain WSM1325) TaxID=395491 RepID=C6B1E1_RHILS|nr:flagellar basal body rod protein FlgB [Rhizobium leguminosarum]ACS54660.1 flagellar basal body rod protein FlgB [Rhizobium leguminosarum bv. trifolii WSM1325]MBY2908919.1 flagellar basal body rod protein FlgB [Rhizobium leguminosarum]MBY2914513.1 flagellar basal body rod protein FlgB [Rhizobium leguminosarum]MBY2921128.1 flagellar basal body rod protein FlgB [Rhizobium leguminosarum]MBY2934939.1 flagellar basal body rod protein FlgB [Rhizobium leguminosarum]